MQENFNENNQTEIAEFIIANLPRHKQFVLGTVDTGGYPWTVCLNLSYDNQLHVIWKSKVDTEHSKHIEKNNFVSLCVYSDIDGIGDFGFYTKAIAHEVTDKDELMKCLDFRFAQKGKEVPQHDDFLGESECRIYVAEIKEAWVNDNRHLKVLVDLDVLRKVMGEK